MKRKFLKTLCCIFLLTLCSSCSSKSKNPAEYLVIKDDGVSSFSADKTKAGAKNFIEVLDKDMKLISKDKIKLNMPFENTYTDEENKKLYCFNEGFVVVDIENKCFEKIDKYLQKGEKANISKVTTKGNTVYYATNEGVENTSEKNWYKSRLVTTDGKIDRNAGKMIEDILFLNNEIYLQVSGIYDSKLIKYNKNSNDFEDVENSFANSGRTKYFIFNKKLFRVHFSASKIELKDFESGKEYFMYYEDGSLFKEYDNIMEIKNYKDDLYLSLSIQEDEKEKSGLYKVSLNEEKFTIKKILPKGSCYTFYNDCVSFSDKNGVHLYDLKTSQLITEYKEENSLVIIKLNK